LPTRKKIETIGKINKKIIILPSFTIRDSNLMNNIIKTGKKTGSAA
jgi:hypothetical protein